MQDGLTAMEARRLFRYDADTGKLYWRVNRGRNKVAGKEAGHIVNTKTPLLKYRSVLVYKQSYYVHRVIFLMAHGYWPKEIDHRDQDGLNNRLENLRETTRQGNMRNARLRKGNSSGVVGVYWNKQRRKWTACVYVDGQRIHLGYFFRFEDAITVRKEAEKQYGFSANHGRNTLKVLTPA